MQYLQIKTIECLFETSIVCSQVYKNATKDLALLRNLEAQWIERPPGIRNPVMGSDFFLVLLVRTRRQKLVFIKSHYLLFINNFFFNLIFYHIFKYKVNENLKISKNEHFNGFVLQLEHTSIANS